MALSQMNHLAHGQASTAAAASQVTGAFTATANRGILASVFFRSNDLADLSAETFRCVSSHSGSPTITLKKTVFYDPSNRCGHAVFLVTGATGSGTFTFDYVSGRTSRNQGWQIIEGQDMDSTAVVQSASATSATTSITPGLAAFANASNFAVIFVYSNCNTAIFTKEAGYTELVNVTGSSGPDSYACEYLGSQDTTPSVTFTSTNNIAAIGLEIQGVSASGAGPASNYLRQMRG